MKAIVLYDTQFGNTEKIANNLSLGLLETGVQTECLNIKAAKMEDIPNYDLIALGGPTQYLTASKPMKEFLARLKDLDLKGKVGFAFDTKLESFMAGSASRFIENSLKKCGLNIIRPRISAIVIGQKNSARIGEAVLQQGMEELFKDKGRELGALVQDRGRRVTST